ncbi:universal stress protein [Halolamina litorea]|uniref:Universal stress protein n=1 Tax=Halolamina litorea TaxID=1515593 RepID=A0ABD6BM13_9EURY|nr:universal stress protein [Halolamina litorea]
MYDHILIGVDGSDESLRAANRGLDLADTFDADVTAVHVISRSTIRLARTDDEEATIRESRESVFAPVEDAAETVGRSIETEVVAGAPARALTDRAAALGADLLVLGRQGASGVSERLLGSVTERVLSSGEVPTLVVPGGASEAGGYERLLLPTDGSENAEAAIPHGGALATAYGAGVDVLNVIDVQAAGGAFNAGGLEKSFIERLEADGEEAVERAAETLREHAPGADVRTAVERTNDGTAARITEYAAANDSDLVVMGSRGRSNLRRKVLGSVAASTLRNVGVPVLVVPRT